MNQTNNHTDMTGKVVVITGGSRGLGFEMAKGFARCGADLVITSRKVEACEEAAQEIRALGRRALAVGCHVGHWEDLQKLIDETIAKFGRMDVLINNAGIAPVAPTSAEMTEELFDKTIAVNTKGPFRLSALAEPYLKKTKGCIINVTSTGALKPEPAYNVYAAAKGALNTLTRSHAMEFGPEVRVNAIMAGPFWTDIAKNWREQADRESTSAVKRIGRPEEIVSTALYLASPMSSYTTGAIITVDGGVL